MAKPLRQFTDVPFDENTSPQMREFLNSLMAQVNALTGQGNPPSGLGIQALSQNLVSPASPQLVSVGNRAGSITTAITWVASATSVTFYWDGTNGSQVLTVYRDDGSRYGPTNAGSPFTVSGLAATTTYFFYPFFQENVPITANWGGEAFGVNWGKVAGVSVGNPPVAFLAKNALAVQQQNARDHIQLAPLFVTTGITTPTVGGGTTTGDGGNGGGGSTGGIGGLLP